MPAGLLAVVLPLSWNPLLPWWINRSKVLELNINFVCRKTKLECTCILLKQRNALQLLVTLAMAYFGYVYGLFGDFCARIALQISSKHGHCRVYHCAGGTQSQSDGFSPGDRLEQYRNQVS